MRDLSGVGVPSNAAVFTLHMQMIGVPIESVVFYWNAWNDTKSDDPEEFAKFLNWVEANDHHMARR